MTEAEMDALDLAVANAAGIALERDPTGRFAGWRRVGSVGWFMPTRSAVEAMALMEKYRLTVSGGIDPKMWSAMSGTPDTDGIYVSGDTACIAICKAVVSMLIGKCSS